MGQTLQWSRTVQHNDFVALLVVRYFGATSLFGILFRLSKASISTSSANKYDSETSADATVVHEFGFVVSEMPAANQTDLINSSKFT